MKKVTILRGLPGSFKTTYIKTKIAQPPKSLFICSADDLFLQRGVYTYDRNKLGEAHRACMKAFVHFVTVDWGSHDMDIVVDNTNTRIDEMLPYVRVAQAYDLPIEVVHLQCSVENSFNRNIHGVPLDSIQNMKDRWQTLPKHWGLTEKVIET